MYKTELLLITGRHIQLQMIVRTKSSVRYLGIRLDPKQTILYRIQYSANRAQKIVVQLSRLMANIEGQRRKLLMEVTKSIMLYGSEIWTETL